MKDRLFLKSHVLKSAIPTASRLMLALVALLSLKSPNVFAQCCSLGIQLTGVNQTAGGAEVSICSSGFWAWIDCSKCFDELCGGAYATQWQFSSAGNASYMGWGMTIIDDPSPLCTSAWIRPTKPPEERIPGTLTILASANGIEYTKDVTIVVDGCSGDSCGERPGASDSSTGSIKNLMNLGRYAFGKRAGLLAIHEKSPTNTLTLPCCLKFNHRTNYDCLIITNAAGIRQARTPEGVMDIVTNSVYKYAIKHYPISAITSTNGDGTVQLSGDPLQTIIVENPDTTGATTNKLRITDGQGRISDFGWDDVGWNLTNGGGIRREYSTITYTNSGTMRTINTQILDVQNVLLSSKATIATNFSFGEEVIQEVAGSGASAITNYFEYFVTGPTGALRQAIYADGRWELRVHPSNSLVRQIFSGFLNQGPTTNADLCTLTEFDYTTNVVAGSINNRKIKPIVPRLTVEYLLGTGKEMSRTYRILSRGQEQEIRCTEPGASWSNANNLVTITKWYTNGANSNLPFSTERPDGTMDVHYYASGSNRTNIVLSGAPDASKTNIIDGTKTVTIVNSVGRTIGRTVSHIATNADNGIVTSQESYSDPDSFGRFRRVTYLDGTFSWMDHGCCGPITETNREGTVINHFEDALKRRAGRKMNNITWTNAFDAAGNLLQLVRIGNDNSRITNVTHTYDTAGRRLSSTEALGNTTTYSESISNYQLTRTTTYPDGGTRIEEYYRDGQLAKVTGTAVNPVRYEHGVEQDGSVWRLFAKEIKLDANGNNTSEWVKTYRDMVGRPYKVLYADNSKRERFYNAKGQLVKEIDPDGVITLFAYNARGELEYTATDMDRDGTIDFNGTDRITQTVRTVTSNNALNVQQTRTYAWSTNNSTVSNLTATIESSTDGLRSWNSNFELTNRLQRVYFGGGNRYETNTAPDGSFTIEHFQHGQLLSTTRKDANGNQLGKTTFTYDSHGRRTTSTDARNGSTVSTYDAADRETVTRTPVPGNGQNGQMTSYAYDWAGRVTQTILPDNTIAYNVYSKRGELLTNYGSRTYPVSYAYDPQGRRTNMVTWTNFGNRSGAAITSWRFDGFRGFMTNKVYADGNGPSYTYTPSGHLRTRKWARNITTTYETNAAADLVSITYSDGTSNVTYNLDRLGRQTNILDGAGSRILSYTPSGLPVLETNTSGVLAGTAIAYQYDQYHRRTNMAIHTPGSTINHRYAFDSASRLTNVSDTTYHATYDYLANSPLVSQISFKSNTTVRMTTTKKYDFLNRLLDITSVPSASSAVKFGYQYNDANQRVRRTDSDESYWSYEYDGLGQVTGAKHHWPDGTPVAGQQFEYTYDDIGNRRRTKEGGDASGSGLRTAHYTVNNLNQYTQRDVPGAGDIIGIAHSSASASVNAQSTYRRGEYYHKELLSDNTSAPVLQPVTNQAIYSSQTNTITGNLFLPKTPQIFSYDNDGNTVSDSVCTNGWDAENRLAAAESTAAVPAVGRAKEAWTFDAEGRWVQRVVYSWTGVAYLPQATNRFAWNDNLLVAILDQNNSVVMSFLRGLDLTGSFQGAGGPGDLIGVDVLTNAAHFCAYDGNGNVMRLTSRTDGTSSGSYDYDPFGNTRRITGAAAKTNPTRFGTQFTDDVADTVRYLNRSYHSSEGRWDCRDPIQERGDLNLYLFVRNNPVTRFDRYGLDSSCVNCEFGEIGRFGTYKDGKYTCRTIEGGWLTKRPGDGELCCEPPAYYTWARNDTIGWSEIQMSIWLHFGGGRNKELVIVWTTCYLSDNTCWYRPQCSNSTTCTIPTGLWKRLSGEYETSVEISYLSCENSRWRTKGVFSNNRSYYGGLTGWTWK
jgi:RHS repeat-associated protein